MLTWVEVNSKAIKHNLKQFRQRLGGRVLIMPVVKANAYGHGFLEVAKIVDQSPDADRLCVVNLDEALELKKNKIKKLVMILSFYELDKKKLLVAAKNKIIFPLYRLDQAKELNKAGERAKQKVKCHLKIDSGAARVGVLPDEAVEFMAQIKKYKFLDIEGIFSHFASSEDDAAYTQKQHQIFDKTIQELSADGWKISLKHMACSAASLVYPEANFNAVRLGLGLYGLYPNNDLKRFINLKPALSWQTSVIQVKTLKTGSKIGYGGTFTTSRPTKLAILPVGYFDGYDRRFSNKAEVIIRGIRCSVRGRICMNLTMVDVSGIPEVKVGDKATLIGSVGHAKVTADELASLAGTINYEIVDRINPLLPRIF